MAVAAGALIIVNQFVGRSALQLGGPATGRGQSTGPCAIPRNQTAMPGLKPMRHLGP